jgi:predicted cupin superfamily sugar epimerase
LQGRNVTAEEIRRLLGLTPLAHEGGFFAETYRASERIPAGFGGIDPNDARPLATAIYYLLTPDTFSALHRLSGDELFHFYLGDPVEMLQLGPGGDARVIVFGTDLAAGMRPQVLAPRGVWQGTRLLPGGRVALLGTTMSPGFDPADFELGRREALMAEYPAHRDRILALTR